MLVLFCAESFAQTLDLTANIQYVRIGNLNVTGNKITVEALVKKSGGTNILSKHTGPGNVNYLLRVGTFEITTTTQFYLMTNPYAGSMLPNNWYHVAGTYDGSFIRYYVNGCLIVQQAATGNMVQNNLITAIGNISSAPNAEQFFGEIDELRVWSETRTAAQLEANMFDLPNPTTYPNLLAYYKFDGNVLNVQGNATYNGTWVGTPSYGAQPATSAIQPFLVQSIIPTDITCYGAADGKITVTATGSDLRYSIDNANWQISNQFTGLTAGTYTVYVRTAEGCVITDGTIIVAEPAQVNATASNTGPYCQNDAIVLSGSTTSTGTLGYAWTGPGGYTSTVQNPTDATTAGIYNLVVTAGGCPSPVASTTVVVGGTLNLTATNTNVLCKGANTGAISTTVTGGVAPYVYSWSPSGGTAANATGLTAGAYTVVVTDNTGCTAIQTATITEPATELAGTLTDVKVHCGSTDGVITTNVTGGTGTYIYNWQPGSQTTSSIGGLSPGLYTVTVTDGNGCQKILSHTLVYDGIINVQATPLTILVDEGAQVNLNATTSPAFPLATYTWTPTSGLSCTDCPNPIATVIVPTIYTVVVSTSDGCTGNADVDVRIKIKCGEYFIPTVFSPNGDGKNDTFVVYGKCIKSMKMKVFNRWGEVVFEGTDLTTGWDGTYNGKDVNPSSFVYMIHLVFIDGTTESRKGSISLVR